MSHRSDSPSLILRGIAIAVVAILGWLLVACGGGSTTASDVGQGTVGTRVEVDGGSYVSITPDVLHSWLEDKDFLLVNVYVPYVGEIDLTDELVPYNEIEQNLDVFPDRDAKIVVYCGSGVKSAAAAETLVRLGYTNVWNLDGGMKAWQAAGYPLVQRLR
jgi:rhodanese-related sulfurtransferase